MIEGIAGIAAVTAFTPSAERSADRRQKRLKWLSSLRAAQGEAGLPADEAAAEGAEAPDMRARIADALAIAEEMRARHDDGPGETTDAAGPAIIAADVARRIATSADRSLAAQAHVGAAAVRRYVGGDE